MWWGRTRRYLPILVFSSLTAASLAGLLLLPALPQDQSYHLFADCRTVAGIPNFWNVVSNIPFIAIGAAGLWRFRDGPATVILFLGFVLTGIGSSYYHWQPNDATLFWDRLPMTLSFAAILSLGVAERVNSSFGASSNCLPEAAFKAGDTQIAIAEPPGFAERDRGAFRLASEGIAGRKGGMDIMVARVSTPRLLQPPDRLVAARCGCAAPNYSGIEFAHDSALEQRGFELLVPPACATFANAGHSVVRLTCRFVIGTGTSNPVSSSGEAGANLSCIA
jgi:hypothetical protein